MKYILIGLLLVGCAEKDTRASWVSVEKPPIRVVYVSKVENISPEVVDGMIESVKDVPYANYPFNPSIEIGLDANSHKSNSESDVVSYTLTK